MSLRDVRRWWLERRAAKEEAELAAEPIVAGHHRDWLDRQANLTFTEHAEADIANPDRRPAADHQPRYETRPVRKPRRIVEPWTTTTRGLESKHPGEPDDLEDG